METFFLKNEDIRAFYDTIASRYRLSLPMKIPGPARVACAHGFELSADEYLAQDYLSMPHDGDVVFNEYRCIEPVRTYFTPPQENIGGYFGHHHESLPEEGPARPPAIAGVKNCDLFALQVQDYVFLQGVSADPAYQQRRETTLIISGDCPSFKESCFCRAFAIDPFVTAGFDLNLSPLSDGFLVDVATPKARELLHAMGRIMLPATVGQISGRQTKRASVARKLDEHLQPHRIPAPEKLQALVRKGMDSKIWKEQMLTCVECGGCVFMCDTCHCFLLTDERTAHDGMAAEKNRRTRVWDGCLYPNFTRVAGGANPLKMRYMRLRNRYIKKFDFFVENLGKQACCGCGRCIDVCPGKIDIRHILSTLHAEQNIPSA